MVRGSHRTFEAGVSDFVAHPVCAPTTRLARPKKIPKIVTHMTGIFRRSHVSLKRHRPNDKAPRHGSAVVSIVVLLLIASVAAGGYWWWTSGDNKSDDDGIILHTVARDDFLLAVTERGEIESADITEVRSEVKTMNQPGLAILRIVPEGTEVEEGDFLVELDSSAFEEERITQQIAVNTAVALVIEARNLYETAVIAKEEYAQGTFVQEKQTIEGEAFVAEENLNRAKEYYEYSQKLAAKGYVNKLQLEADKFAVEKSKKELEAAKTKLNVLEQFTKAKMITQLTSDIKIGKAKWDAEKNSLELATTKLQEIQDRIAKCMITAPRAGVVVYNHETDRRGQDDFIVEEGAVIRERQTIIQLPSDDSMRVVVTINESLVQFVKPGMTATVSPVGVDRVLRGTVENVNRYAEPTGWRKANVKEYEANIRIADSTSNIRSGMTAAVTIHCDYVPDTLQIPVQAIYAHGDQYYCFVFNEGRLEARPVVCGPTNDRFFVVHEGLAEADRVAMNPRRYLERVELPDLPRGNGQRVARIGPMTPLESSDTPSDTATTDQASLNEPSPLDGLGEQADASAERTVPEGPRSAAAPISSADG
jgi:RND family efflux transporter MFP subunit